MSYSQPDWPFFERALLIYILFLGRRQGEEEERDLGKGLQGIFGRPLRSLEAHGLSDCQTVRERF